MRNLVALAVIGVCFASCQAGNIGYGAYGHPGAYGHAGAYQPRWTGPVAATVPAGIGGKIIPVSDTYEVAAARKAFFQAYDHQLAKVGGLRYGASHYSGPHGYGGPSHGPAHTFGGPGYYGAAAHGYGGVSHGPVHDTPEVAAAKAQFFTLYNKQAAAAAAAPDHYTYHSKPHHY